MKRNLVVFLVSTIGFTLFSCATAYAEGRNDWPKWRGASDTGSTPAGNYPNRLAAENIRWQAPLPGKGCSTPIVLDETIYVTVPVDGNDALLAFDWSGRQTWVTTFGPEEPGKHRNGSGSNSSPASDGDAVFALFKSGTLAAVNLDGSVRWKTDLVERFGKIEMYWDYGASPVLTQNHVVVARMHAGESWLAAFDKTTGELAWKVPRNFNTPLENDQGYASPLVMEHDGKEAVLVWGAEHITIHDPDDGKVVWSCGDFNPGTNKLWPSIATPVIVGDMVVISYGRNDRGLPRLYGIRLNGSGDVTETNHVWMRDDVASFVPSPIAYDGHIFLVRDRGEVECIDPETGNTVWSDQFPKARASYYASPLIAGGKLYAPREDGVVFVADVSANGFEILSENDLGEPVVGSPVAAADRIFIRGEKHLFCLANP